MSIPENKIKLDNDILIPKGNFAFVYEYEPSIYEILLNAEKKYKTNSKDFGRELRDAFEHFAKLEYAKEEHRKGREDDIEIIMAEKEKAFGGLDDNCKKTVKQLEYVKNRKRYYKDIVDRCGEVGECWNKIDDFIYSFYGWASDLSHDKIKHATLKAAEKSPVYFKLLHEFLRVYYDDKTAQKPDFELCPIGDYYPVPDKEALRMGIKCDKDRHLFVREGEKLEYVLFVKTTDENRNNKKEADVIEKLWYSSTDPQNVMKKKEDITCKDNQKYILYSLPSRPLALNEEIVNTFTEDDKLSIIKGICMSIESCHKLSAPIYLRDLSPNSFCCFKITNSYKAQLVSLAYAKDTDKNSTTTVGPSYTKKAKRDETSPYIAPEFWIKKNDDTIWKKADYYAVAKTCLFVIKPELVEAEKNKDVVFEELVELGINDQLAITLHEMINPDPEKRQKIHDLVDVIKKEGFSLYKK